MKTINKFLFLTVALSLGLNNISQCSTDSYAASTPKTITRTPEYSPEYMSDMPKYTIDAFTTYTPAKTVSSAPTIEEIKQSETDIPNYTIDAFTKYEPTKTVSGAPIIEKAKQSETDIPNYTIDAFTTYAPKQAPVKTAPKAQMPEQTVDPVTGLPIYTIEAPMLPEAPKPTVTKTPEVIKPDIKIETVRIAPATDKKVEIKKERARNVRRAILITGSVLAAALTLYVAITYKTQLANAGQSGYAMIANLVKQYGPKATQFLGDKISSLKSRWNNWRNAKKQAA